MNRTASFMAAMLVAVSFLSSCKKKVGGSDHGTAEASGYDNTAARFDFYERRNKEVIAQIEASRAELEKALAGDLPEADRKEKTQALDDVKRRLERPKYFEILSEADLPKDLQWTTNNDEPELGSPKAKKGGTFHSFIQGGAYPPTIRQIGKEANNSFRSYHWDDIEMSFTNLHAETGKIIPALADRWCVAADGQTIYYHLDEAARWSDGKDVKSGDFLMAMYIYLSDYLSEAFYRNYYGEQFWGIATYGDDYVCIRMATPKPLAPYMANINPFQEEFYKEFGPDFESRYNWRTRPTTGAYQILDKDIDKGRSIAMSRVQNWWAKDRKYYRYRFNPDKLQYLQIRNEETIFQMFLKEDIDVYWPLDSRRWYEQTEIPLVFNGYIEKATYYNEYPTVSRGMYMNMHHPILANQDVRIGLQYASNWQKVIDFDMRGDAERLNILEGGFGDFSHPTLQTRPFNVNLAREAFARAGFTETGSDGILKDSQGRRLSFNVNYVKHPMVDPWLLRIKEEAKRAGVEFKLEGMDQTASYQKTMRKEHEIVFSGWQNQPPIPDYYQAFHSKEAFEPGSDKPRPMTNNITVFADPEVDKILEANRGARSEDVVRETSHKLEEIFHERAVWVPSFNRPFYRVAYWRWIRWPDDFNVRLGNDPEMNHVLWIDPDIKKETKDAMRDGKTFPEKNLVFDQHRRKRPAPAAK